MHTGHRRPINTPVRRRSATVDAAALSACRVVAVLIFHALALAVVRIGARHYRIQMPKRVHPKILTVICRHRGGEPDIQSIVRRRRCVISQLRFSCGGCPFACRITFSLHGYYAALAGRRWRNVAGLLPLCARVCRWHVRTRAVSLDVRLLSPSPLQLFILLNQLAFMQHLLIVRCAMHPLHRLLLISRHRLHRH